MLAAIEIPACAATLVTVMPATVFVHELAPAAPLEADLAGLAVPCALLRPLSQVLPDLMGGERMTLPVRQTVYPGGVMRDFGGGYQADGDPGQALAAAPRLGQHTRAILQSLLVSDEDIAALAAQGVIQVEA